jgi:perosamine synthetase
VNSEYATSVTNGTVAIHLALKALNIGEGDEVIVPTFTYVASVNSIVQAGAKPVFVDSIERTLQIDPDDVARKITARTKAIMAVHLYGFACDMTRLLEICSDNKLFLIEDCAEALGTYFKNQHVGTFGDIGTFSFFGNKTITTGEGGMLVFKNAALWQKAAHLKNQGVSKDIEYWHDVLAYNYRMTNICSAIGLAQLEKADEFLAKKRKIAEYYQQELQGLPLRFHEEEPNIKHSFWMCTIILNSGNDRDPLRKYLKGRGIETRPLFPPCHKLPHLLTNEVFAVAESISARGINLPSYPDLELEDIKNISQVVRDYFKSIGM